MELVVFLAHCVAVCGAGFTLGVGSQKKWRNSLHEAQERERIAYEELQKMRKRAEKAERELKRYERVSRQGEESYQDIANVSE